MPTRRRACSLEVAHQGRLEGLLVERFRSRTRTQLVDHPLITSVVLPEAVKDVPAQFVRDVNAAGRPLGCRPLRRMRGSNGYARLGNDPHPLPHCAEVEAGDLIAAQTR